MPLPSAQAKFAGHYKALTDEELLELAIERHTLSEDADAALAAELARRSLGETELEEHRKARQESDTEPEAKAELPPEHAREASRPLRPRGIPLLAASLVVGGGLLALQAWALLATQPVIAVLETAASVLFVLVAHGLWRVRRWAHSAATIINALNVLAGLLLVIGAALLRVLAIAVVPFEVVLFEALAVIWNALYFYYLQSPDVRKAFGKTE